MCIIIIIIIMFIIITIIIIIIVCINIIVINIIIRCISIIINSRGEVRAELLAGAPGLCIYIYIYTKGETTICYRDSFFLRERLMRRGASV